MLRGEGSGIGEYMETPEPITIFVIPASEDGVPIWVEDQDNDFVKNHSSVGIIELANSD